MESGYTCESCGKLTPARYYFFESENCFDGVCSDCNEFHGYNFKSNPEIL